MKKWIKDIMKGRKEKSRPQREKKSIPTLRAAVKKEFKIGKGKKVDIKKIKKSREKK